MIMKKLLRRLKEQSPIRRKLFSAEAIRLDTLEKEEKAKQHYTDEDWDLIRAKIEANAELSKSVLGSGLQGEDFAKKMVELVNQRKKHFAEERARAKRNKPMTQSQLRTYMMNYLKNQGTWKLSQLKNLCFEEVKEEFDKLVKQVESFAPINFEATKDSLKRFGEELQTKTSKRLKGDSAKDDESTKKTRQRRKQIARKGLHSDKTDEDESKASKDADPIFRYKIPISLFLPPCLRHKDWLVQEQTTLGKRLSQSVNGLTNNPKNSMVINITISDLESKILIIQARDHKQRQDFQSSHFVGIPYPPLPVSSPLPRSPPSLPASPTYPLGYRAAMIRLRAESPSTSHPLPLPSPIVLPHTRASVAMMRAIAPSTYILASPSETPPSGTPPHLHIPLPTPSPPLLIPSIDRRVGVPEAELPPQKRLRDYSFFATLDDEIRRDPDRDVGYGITYTWDEMVEAMQGTPIATDVAGLSKRMTDFVMTVRQDTDEIYGRLDDAQDDRSLMSGQLNLQQIRALRVADRTRQAQLTEALTLMRTLQTQVTTLQSHQGPARGPAHPDIPEEANSSS
ncbi:hypothetical protein Tco_0715912 [Tanacetum coccineum]